MLRSAECGTCWQGWTSGWVAGILSVFPFGLFLSAVRNNCKAALHSYKINQPSSHSFTDRWIWWWVGSSQHVTLAFKRADLIIYSALIIWSRLRFCTSTVQRWDRWQSDRGARPEDEMNDSDKVVPPEACMCHTSCLQWRHYSTVFWRHYKSASAVTSAKAELVLQLQEPINRYALHNILSLAPSLSSISCNFSKLSGLLS